MYLASSPELEGVTGTYLADRKPKASSPASHDTAAAARLWQISCNIEVLSSRTGRLIRTLATNVGLYQGLPTLGCRPPGLSTSLTRAAPASGCSVFRSLADR
jgi:hypothetical protein